MTKNHYPFTTINFFSILSLYLNYFRYVTLLFTTKNMTVIKLTCKRKNTWIYPIFQNRRKTNQSKGMPLNKMKYSDHFCTLNKKYPLLKTTDSHSHQSPNLPFLKNQNSSFFTHRKSWNWTSRWIFAPHRPVVCETEYEYWWKKISVTSIWKWQETILFKYISKILLVNLNNFLFLSYDF